MITFFVGSAIRKQNFPLPQVHLVIDNWNDWWEFKTLYGVIFYDKDGNRHDLGGIKIGAFNLNDEIQRPDLPQVFTQLDENFFSLGQDVEYYETIKDFGDELRENFHQALNDIAFDEQIFEKAINEKVTTNSLMRFVTKQSIEGQFRRLAQGDSTLTDYNFTYTSPRTREVTPFILEFEVLSNSNPPTNIHAIIGRNGVGKTHLMDNMIHSLIKAHGRSARYGKFASSLNEDSSKIFANLVSVSFSAFDETELVTERRNKADGIMYSYIGLRSKSSKVEDVITTKSPTKLKREFARSAYICKIGGKTNRLKNAIDELEADAIFSEANLKEIFALQDQKEFETLAADKFHRLSSGHKIVLLTITRLVETVEERSLVLIDEPEAHLHPPLLSAFIRSLSNLLIRRNGVAIITTHSPVVLQEVPKSCCWKLRRVSTNAIAERLEMESFGENVGSLTQEAFGLEVTHAGFHTLLQKSVERHSSYNQVINDFGDQLGMEAKAIVRGLINMKNNY